jgi:benzoyl-CoA reductase subunit A
MRYSVGIDLGSTTTKAIVLGEDGEILGRGITNSRSSYKVACDVALSEALIDARFGLIAGELDRSGATPEEKEGSIADLERGLRKEQYRHDLARLSDQIHTFLGEADDASSDVGRAVDGILGTMADEVSDLYRDDSERKSDFFRDLAGGRYLSLAEQRAADGGVDFDRMVGLFDKAILVVENLPPEPGAFRAHMKAALAGLPDPPAALPGAVRAATNVDMEEASSVGTGYGRRTLPFPKEMIRSEILCHGLGAHHMFPGTRTVLDIGGQDTKAIQVDAQGIVTSFQMNDRCAAGCGRYLGYIADEMNLGVHELGPLAKTATRTVRINSTCTVFAGAELRERLSLGERREDILLGLHRAIILRALSLLARSGGVEEEFTFTGGVAKNLAAVEALTQLIAENYGDMTINISPDSIYTGALGAALFARREEGKSAGKEVSAA